MSHDHWEPGEVAVIAAAMSRAPSVHNSQPWALELRERAAEVHERVDLALPRHDPLGRDRLISCGAALTNVRLAVRRLGYRAEVTEFPDPGRPGEVGRVVAGARAEPTGRELALYRAIRARHSHRARFGPERVAPAVLGEVVDTVDVPGVGVRAVRPEDVPALAHVLVYSASVVQHDRAYQRELAAWTAKGHQTDDGLVPAAAGTLPWAGLVDERTALPDEDVLGRRLSAETEVLITTVDDGPVDHLRAGIALEELWLAATAAGLAASVITQPLHLPEARAGLIERLDLAGYPQALLRVGQRTEIAAPSARRPFTALISGRTTAGAR
ncbi:Acg family FMN-binding oxidoreductase [Actinokineospora iranica]|uniref:Nitroreductase family protein n=1 Tax=Actinokineospora iranica TaxID=1271860 RepID=A0A1G6JRT9_9PSEU|nr:nitroreductase family protein [Actinokineospora iranica]SDC21459.1 Nitroreductase family protein [Actinokineospora iranica]